MPADRRIRLMLVATDPDTEKKAAEDRQLGAAGAGDRRRRPRRAEPVRHRGRATRRSTSSTSFRSSTRRERRCGPPHRWCSSCRKGRRRRRARRVGAQRGRRGRARHRQRSISAGQHDGAVRLFAPFGSGTMTIRAEDAGAADASQPHRSEDRCPADDRRRKSREQRDMSAEGQNYIVGQGPARGGRRRRWRSRSRGLPHHAGMAAQPGAGACVNRAGGRRLGRSATAAGRSAVATERSARAGASELFADLAALEEQRREGSNRRRRVRGAARAAGDGARRRLRGARSEAAR